MPVDYQAFSSRLATWENYIKEDCQAGCALRSIFGDYKEVTLSRSDLRGLTLAPENDMVKFIMATIIWGYPRGMRGKNINYLIKDIGRLADVLTEGRGGVDGWSDHYENIIKNFKGIGLSTYTKLLSFLGIEVDGYISLILDERIIRVANRGVFDDMERFSDMTYQNANGYYPRYLELLNTTDDDIQVRPEQLEYFIFNFGLNLKSPARILV